MSCYILLFSSYQVTFSYLMSLHSSQLIEKKTNKVNTAS